MFECDERMRKQRRAGGCRATTSARHDDGFLVTVARWFCLLAGWCLAACSGDTDIRAALERENVRLAVVDNRPPFAEWAVADDPVLRIGTTEGAAPYQFRNVRFAARLQDGRVVVVDGVSREIRWYDAFGQFHSSVGRRGQGPGEFRDIRSAILTFGDSLVVHDLLNQRLTWLSPSEQIVREERLIGIEARSVHLLNVHDGGRIVIGESRPVLVFGSSDFSYARDSVAILVRSQTRLDILAVVPGGEAVTWVRYEGGQPRATLQMELPFGFQVLPGATRQHIVLAAGDERQLEILNDAAMELLVVRRSGAESVPVSDTDRRHYIDYVTQQARSLGAPDLALVIRGARDRLALLPEGRAMPPFDRLIVDTEDRIWIRDYMPVWSGIGNPQVWTVYSVSGGVLARARTPGGVEIMHVGRGHITGVQRDEFDVEYVTVYRFSDPLVGSS